MKEVYYIAPLVWWLQECNTKDGILLSNVAYGHGGQKYVVQKVKQGNYSYAFAGLVAYRDTEQEAMDECQKHYEEHIAGLYLVKMGVVSQGA